MIAFETQRLLVKPLSSHDEPFFVELLDNPDIINPIPQPKFSKEEILEKFETHKELKKISTATKRAILGVFEKDTPELIGLALFLTNEDNDREIGYRFRKPFWGKGYATELTKSLIDYCFNKLNHDKVTADVWIQNKASDKVLSKFMQPVKEFYNERDKTNDRRYMVAKKIN